MASSASPLNLHWDKGAEVTDVAIAILEVTREHALLVLLAAFVKRCRG